MLAIDEYKKAAGHVLVSRGRLERVGEEPLALAMLGPIGVLPDRQGEGAGTALMRAAISYATQRHYPLLCLVGDPAYYRRFKFEPGRAVGIEPAVDYPDENWLVLRLIDWTPGLQGVAHAPLPDGSARPRLRRRATFASTRGGGLNRCAHRACASRGMTDALVSRTADVRRW